ncbi:hypothetical protein CAOG_06443 [Capsaspora owczarzaki ATCC 30864]|uniref:Actin-related protein 2/3 complex subunit n=1 Tax=Capsaspora owczarzaki (strain ATCC 30864) TaxID=595528 RepID=A0A0D2WU21_CAPO3|nr:hypothetical protein CAOG_06443 [Capsaspora owczarzaki ATCC 30864]KJE96070.1 hypothetical protein CAOG_006443 [Capsaspora owczarzaki ATCC 30864]|eukprot:XP_004345192.1 hypothetical protein CAOG_06443 [Capsaspora owczarzaki ATCC 30864]
MSEPHHLLSEPISCHAWNKDRSQLAFSPNNHEIHIYKKEGNTWVKSQVLTGHDQRVTSLDWAANTNRIVSCGADRNAYVWTITDNEWKPSLVILRINRAATFVRWSPKEDKFAVASGARLISICYFEAEHDWWVSKHIKKPIRSTVLTLDWHPNNVLLAAGSSDFKTRIFFAGIKGVDEKPQPTPWGGKNAFGDCVRELSHGPGGWVHSVAFSPSGNRLAWVSHNSSISVVEAGDATEPKTVTFSTLPYVTLLWASENSIITAGFEYYPALWDVSSGTPKFVNKLDHAVKKAAVEGNAMSKFRNLDTRATEGEETALDTVHQNPITQLSLFAGTKDRVTKFTTTGSDGRLVNWDVKALESAISGLKFA